MVQDTERECSKGIVLKLTGSGVTESKFKDFLRVVHWLSG